MDFIADNFAPNGSIVINLYMHELSQTVTGCEANDLKDCWQKALQSTLSIRPYRGDKSCYDDSDLYVVLLKNPSHIDEFILLKRSIPFLRNEIYARKGYIFTSDKFRHFINRLSWYEPKQSNVHLNEIEKWNIEFLQEVETGIKSEKRVDENIDVNEDSDQARDIYYKMSKKCPGVNSGQ